MTTELESHKNVDREVANQMELLERKVSSIASLVSRLKSEKQDLEREKEELANAVRSFEERLAAVDAEGAERKLKALREENELLQDERQAVARRIGDLLDKLDHISE